MADDTRTKLMQAALDTIRESGLAAASARTIAGRAGANQALIFYHFGTVNSLIEAATRASVEAGVEQYRAEFAEVTSLSQLLSVGRSLHARERGTGNVALMAQLMAGAQHDEVLAKAAGHAMAAWSTQIAEVLQRVLRGSVLEGTVDIDGLAHAVSAGFIGLELYEGAHPAGADQALAALDHLGQLVETLDNLGPVATTALRGATRRVSAKQARRS